MNDHQHNWIETHKHKTGTQYKCEGCGGIMSIGPGHIENEEEAFRRRVIETVVADLKANGPIRRAMIGVYPND